MSPSVFPRALVALALILAAGAPAAAQSRFTLEKDGAVVGVKGLAALVEACRGKSTLRGTVVARDVVPGKTLLTGFTVETARGRQTTVNVETDRMAAKDVAAIMPVLIRLLEVGRKVEARVAECGGGMGTFFFLDAMG